MPRLATIEDYAQQLNLTPEQQEFNRIWHQLSPIQKRGQDMPYCGVLFKPAVRRVNRNERGRIKLLRPNRLVVRASEVATVFINRIPTNHWRGDMQNRAFRINMAEVPVRVFPDDGEIHISANEVPSYQVYQVDLGINPRQDGQLFDERHWAVDQMIPQDPELRSTRGGQFEIRRNSMYCDLAVDDIVLYRFPLDELSAVEFATESLAIVNIGDVLVKFSGPVSYGEAVFDDDGRPKIHRVRPPVVSVDRKKPLLKMCLKSLDNIVKATLLPMDSDERPEVPPMSTWAPTQLAEFDLRTFSQLRDLPGWEENVDLWSGLRQAVAPGQDFFLCSPCDDDLIFSHTDEGDETTEVVFTLPNDDRDEIVIDIPCCSVVLDSIKQPGAVVRRGDPIADWVPRRHYSSWTEVKKLLGLSWPFAIDAFLVHEAIWPGELVRDDYEVLIDSRYVQSVLAHSATKHSAWLDFRSCADYLDDDLGAIIPPPVPQEDWQDMIFTCNGIGYDMRPAGDRLTSSPICEQVRPRRNRELTAR